MGLRLSGPCSPFFVGGSSSFSSFSPPCLLACLTMSEQRSAVFRIEGRRRHRAFQELFQIRNSFFKEKKRSHKGNTTVGFWLCTAPLFRIYGSVHVHSHRHALKTHKLAISCQDIIVCHCATTCRNHPVGRSQTDKALLRLLSFPARTKPRNALFFSTFRRGRSAISGAPLQQLIEELKNKIKKGAIDDSA